MPIVSESGYSWVRSHSSSSTYTAGYTETVAFSMPSDYVTIRTALMATQATNTGPYAGAIGIVSVGFVDLPSVSYGADPLRWAGLIFGKVRTYVIGLHVTRGTMAGSASTQIWR